MSRPALSLLAAFLSTPAVAADLPPGAVARLGAVALRHPDRPTCLAFTPDGRALVSGGTDGTLRAWDPATGVELARVTVPNGVVTALAVSADGRALAADFGDGKVRLFDPRTLKLLRAVPCEGADAIALNRDGGLVGAVRSTGPLPLIEAATGLDRMELPNGKALAFTLDGSAVAASDAADTVTVYEIPSGKPRLSLRHPNREGVTAVAVSPDGSRLATADPGDTGRVRVWDLKSGGRLAEWPGQGPVAFRPDGTLVGRRGDAVAVWDVKADKPLREIDAGALTFAVSPDGKRLATAGWRTRIRLWDIETGKEQPPARADTGEVLSLTPAADGNGMVFGTTTGVMWWSPGETAPRPVPGRGGPAGLVGGRLVAAYGRGVGVWGPPADGKEWVAEPARLLDGVAGKLGGVAGSPDGKRVALVTDERAVTVADPGTGQVARSWTSPAAVLGLALTGDRVTVIGHDGFVRCWDLTAPATANPPEAWKGRVARSLSAAAAAPADGRFVAVTSIIRVTLFDARTGAQLFAFGRKWEDGPFCTATVSPDGRLVAAGTQGGAGGVVVWEVATRTAVRRFAGGSGTVQFVAFLDGGRRVASVGHDDTVTVWDLTGRPDRAAPTDAELRAAWGRLDRDDGEAGFPPVWVLAAGGDRGLVVIRDGLARAGETDARVKKLIKDLDADAFRTREAAAADLKALGVRALPVVTAAAESHPSAEARRRAEEVVAALTRAGVTIPAHGLYGEPLRQVRAVAALEAIGGPEAVKLLEELQKRGGRPGEEADLALKRMARK
jgi:WD40 repeat protein